MREIIVDWTVTGAAPANTITYWDDLTAVSAQRIALDAYLRLLLPRLASVATYTVRTEGRTMDPTTGTLTGFWSEPTPQTGVGTGLGATGADATQVIAGWLTETVVAGRRVQGRSFIPGLIQTTISNGNLGTAARATFLDAGNTLVASAAGFSVWSRPKDPTDADPAGRPGVLVPVTSAKVPTMLGVQRRRRA